VWEAHPRQHGLTLRRAPLALALRLDHAVAQDEGAHPGQGRDGYRCTVHVRPGDRWPETRLLEVHHTDNGESDVLLVPDSELATVCRKHNPRGG
jgi:hypothetical protein